MAPFALSSFICAVLRPLNLTVKPNCQFLDDYCPLPGGKKLVAIKVLYATCLQPKKKKQEHSSSELLHRLFLFTPKHNRVKPFHKPASLEGV
jgi:hypothetical protein